MVAALRVGAGDDEDVGRQLVNTRRASILRHC
jgi:hypothetical protein